MLNMDTYLVNLSDMHSGSSRALFPGRMVQFEHTNYTPTPQQKTIHKHWLKCAEYVRANRENKKLVIVHNGDAIEGIHHQTFELVSHKWDDHQRVHIDLMDEFLRACDFGEGDQLHYVSGTESHTADKEKEIADDLGASYQHELKLDINGVNIWYAHKGAGAGDGANRGDPYRNWLKRIYWNNLAERMKQPDIIISGHYHKPVYNTYVQDYHTIHGIILPSWQMKTRFAYGAAPFQRNSIGLGTMDITDNGFIKIHKPLILEMK